MRTAVTGDGQFARGQIGHLVFSFFLLILVGFDPWLLVDMALDGTKNLTWHGAVSSSPEADTRSST